MWILQKIQQNKAFRIGLGIVWIFLFVTFKYFYRFSFEIQEALLPLLKNGWMESGMKVILVGMSYSFDILSYALFCYLFTLNAKYSAYLIVFYALITILYFSSKMLFHFIDADYAHLEQLILRYRNQIFSPLVIIFYLPGYYVYRQMQAKA